jgi:cellulose synthase/poly-beta-1,6-N-acetylglucosamine synthase-like glycosyltransferase
MSLLLSYSLVAASLCLAIPVAVLLVEAVGALARPTQYSEPPERDSSKRIAVLVPAHNEGAGLAPTLADAKAQLLLSDRLLVVADNCTDDTAAVALAAGATVTVRTDPARLGKSYALAFGIDSLRKDPPDIVIILDADCRLADGTITWLANACASTSRPVQALDLMLAPSDAPLKYRVMEFVWRIKNWVRPLGLKAIGLPCQLMGTGMAFPWRLIAATDLASGSLVEDLKLGLDLATAKAPPLFCPLAVVTSEFPLSVEGLETQRLRWERGHLRTILASTPRLVLTGIRKRNLGLVALALDAAVPPLSLLVVLILAVAVIAGMSMLVGASSTALLICVLSFTGLAAAVVLSWLRFGRDLVSGPELLALASHVVTKVPIYHKIFFRKSARQWIRTDRRKT